MPQLYRHGLSQADLAARIPMDPATLHNALERGTCSLRTFTRIHDALMSTRVLELADRMLALPRVGVT